MRNICLLLLISALSANCSSSAPTSKIETSASNNSAVSINSAGKNINEVAVRPVNQASEKVNLAAENSSNADQPRLRDSSISRENIEKMRLKKDGNRNVAPIPAAAATPFTAPDGSQIYSSMNSQGVPFETRTFKNNRILLKVERTFEDGSHPITKVYLKNGQILVAPPGTITNSATATAEEFLRAVGVRP